MSRPRSQAAPASARRPGARRRPSDQPNPSTNEVAGFKFATVGVLYAVLLAFAVIVVWEKFTDAETAMAQEAGAAATIYRLANGLGDNAATAARDRLSGYIRKLIDQEWPAMEQGWRQQSRNSCIGRKVQARPPTRRTVWQPPWRGSGGRSWPATREFPRSARGAEELPDLRNTSITGRKTALAGKPTERKALLNKSRGRTGAT